MRTLRPLGDRIIVRVVEASDETASGIKLAGGAIEQPPEAVVLQMGPMAPKGFIQPGSHVLYVKYAGIQATFEGEEVLILQPKDIVAVIEEDTVGIVDAGPTSNASGWKDIRDPATSSPFV